MSSATQTSDPDAACAEAVAWNALSDHFVVTAIRLELQLLETRHRAALVEEESSHRIFYYNSLMYGVSGQAARLARHFSALMDDVTAMQANHDRMQAEKNDRVAQIQEYHAKMILEHRSQAEAQAASFANKIETLRADERDLRVRVQALRQEAEASYEQLEKRRNDSLEERRRLETDLQRLQGEVSNQKYFLDRINAQVETAKMRLRESERAAAENYNSINNNSSNSAIGGGAASGSSPLFAADQYQGGAGAAAPPSASLHSRRISPPALGSGGSAAQYQQQPNARFSISPADQLSQSRASPSPSRHGDSIATALSHVQTVRDMGVDEQFVRYGRTAGTGSPQRFLNSSGSNAVSSASIVTPRPVAASPLQASVQQVGLGSAHRFGYGYDSAYAAGGAGASTGPGGRNSSPPPPPGASRGAPAPGGLATPSGRGGVVLEGAAPSQWQLRLMRLQGELKSLKTDLGVASPLQQSGAAAQRM